MQIISLRKSFFSRLEFLGDAVLDFLVTRHIFVNHKDITPGKNDIER